MTFLNGFLWERNEMSRMHKHKNIIAQSAGAVEYTDCTSAEV